MARAATASDAGWATSARVVHQFLAAKGAMPRDTPETAPDVTGLEATLSDGYATVHELETRTLQLERHCDALLARGADAEHIRAVMLARRALNRELEALRTNLERLRTAEG